MHWSLLHTVHRFDRETHRDHRSTRIPSRLCREYFSDRAKPACRLLYWERICFRVASSRISLQIPDQLPYLKSSEKKHHQNCILINHKYVIDLEINNGSERRNEHSPSKLRNVKLNPRGCPLMEEIDKELNKSAFHLALITIE